MAGQQHKPELGATRNNTFTIKQQQTIISSADVNYFFLYISVLQPRE